MKTPPEKLHPKFIEALEALQAFTEDEKLNLPGAQKWLNQAFIYAPEEVHQEVREKNPQLDLIIAELFDTPKQEVEQRLADLNDGGISTEADPSNVYHIY